MRKSRTSLLSTTVIPFVVVVGVAAAGAVVAGQVTGEPAYAACNPCNPCAAANPCNPCAAACNPCNPCAAANPCNPCSPCNPCAAGANSANLKCAVPRLQAAAACNPCAVAKPCNPCAVAACNPCNPCAAANPCNPCAAVNPCNPCAAAACNPCNPCAGACNPCGAGGAVELSDAEAATAYDCLLQEMRAAYAKSGHPVATSYSDWRRYSTNAYVSKTHGSRYVQNYGNPEAKSYGEYENADGMPAGAVLAKDSFMVKANGQVSVGPLFIMEKMQVGFYDNSEDWRYTMIMPNGQVFGTTKGEGSSKVEFCIGCHVSAEVDSLMFMPEKYRVK